jgi:hypothetical protein
VVRTAIECDGWCAVLACVTWFERGDAMAGIGGKYSAAPSSGLSSSAMKYGICCPTIGESRGVRLFGTSIIRASSTVWPVGYAASRVFPMCSSGPKMRSGLALLLAASLLTSLSVTSGESKLRPNEFAYLRRITSRTSSTRSSAPTITCVGDEPGLLTQILRFAMASTGFEASSSRTMRWCDFLLPARESAAKPEY